MSTVELSGRVAVVTGAGGGLGRSHSLALAAHGARVVVNDRLSGQRRDLHRRRRTDRLGIVTGYGPGWMADGDTFSVADVIENLDAIRDVDDLCFPGDVGAELMDLAGRLGLSPRPPS